MHPFFKSCPSVARRKRLPKGSELRNLMEARSPESGEIIIALGICEKGPIIALTHLGRVLCFQVEDEKICEEDFEICEFEANRPAQPVSKWLGKVPTDNFLEGAQGRMTTEQNVAPVIRKMKDTLKMSVDEYSDEDFGGANREELFKELGISDDEESWVLQDVESDESVLEDEWVRLFFRVNLVEDYVERRKRELAQEAEEIFLTAHYRFNIIRNHC